MFAPFQRSLTLGLCLLTIQAFAQSGSPPQSLLVLKTGRVLSGQISESPGGYVVDNPSGNSGSMRVPFSLVRFEAKSLRDAYLKLRRYMPEITATNRIDLARWCIMNGLKDEARLELRDALRLEPQRSEARTLLRRLDHTSSPSSSLMLTLPKSESTSPTFDRTEAKSLAGLSRPLAEQFVARVQPLLVNKCSNAGCHNQTSEQEFRLKRIRAGRGHRLYSRQNLAAVLKRVDTERPHQSKLLVALHDGHARTGSDLLEGRAGVAQAETIRQWVVSVIAEQTGKDPRFAITPNPRSLQQPAELDNSVEARPIAPSKILAASSSQASKPSTSPTATGFGHSFDRSTGSGRERSTQGNSAAASPSDAPTQGNSQQFASREPSSTPPLQQRRIFPFMPALPESSIGVPESDDPFDPAEFNRLYGSQR